MRALHRITQSAFIRDEAAISETEFFALSASADQEFDPKKQRQPDVDESIASDEVANVTADFAALSIDKEFGRNCMGIVDTDRLSLAKEHGYRVAMSSLVPLTCTPRNNIILGWPQTAPSQ